MAKITTREWWATHLLLSGGTDGDRAARAEEDLHLKPPRQQRRTRPRAEREGGIQDAVLAMLRLHPRIAWAVRMNAGAYKTPDGRFIRFGFVGCPDIWFMVRGGRLGVFEVKQPTEKPTEAQAAFLKTVKDNGGIAEVVTSADQAAAILKREGVWQ